MRNVGFSIRSSLALLLVNIFVLTFWAPVAESQSDKNRKSEHHIDATALRPSQTASAQQGEKTADIVQTVMKLGQFTILSSLLEASGLAESLKDQGPFTLLAPTDAAFTKLPTGKLEEWKKPENKEKLRLILSHHVLTGKITIDDFSKLNGKSVKTIGSHELPVGTSTDLNIGGTKVMEADVIAANGIIHVVEAVLLPIEADATQSTQKGSVQ